MKAIKMIIFSAVVVFFFSFEGFAFRCGADLVTSGDTRIQVLTTCGKPTSKEKSCEGRSTTARVDKDGKVIKSKKCSTPVEIWYYNCGSNDYIYALTFENGILKRESTEGQGKGKSDCRGR